MGLCSDLLLRTTWCFVPTSALSRWLQFGLTFPKGMSELVYLMPKRPGLVFPPKHCLNAPLASKGRSGGNTVHRGKPERVAFAALCCTTSRVFRTSDCVHLNVDGIRQHWNILIMFPPPQHSIHLLCLFLVTQLPHSSISTANLMNHSCSMNAKE